MAYRTEAKSVLIDASGNKTISLSDFGGEAPKFAIAQSTKSTSDGNYQDHLRYSFGWGNITDQEDSAQLGSADNVGTSEVARALHDNILTLLSNPVVVVSSSVANPSVITAIGHGFSNGDVVSISGHSGSTPAIDGEHTISNVTADTFTIPVNVTVGGTGGFCAAITDQITLVSFGADEVVINVGTWDGTDFTVLFLILGGSTLTDVYVDSFNIPTAADVVTNSNIAFFEGGGGASTITSVTSEFPVFSAGQIIEVSGSASNDGQYTIVSVTASTITLATGVLTDEGAGASVSILSGFILVQGAGFSPDAGMLFTTENDNGGGGSVPFIDVNNRELAFSFGFFERGGTQCAESHIYSEHESATMETLSVAGLDDRCWAHYSFKSGVWALRGELTFDSMHATDGFILQQAISNVPMVAYRVNYVVLKGGNYEVVKKAAPTSAGTQDIVNSGFTPSGSMLLFGSVTSAAMSMGWASNKDGTKVNTKEGVVFVSDDDAIATSDTKRLTKTDKCLVHDGPGSTSPDNEANIETWNPNGATLRFTTASIGYFYHAIMFGDGTVTPASMPFRRTSKAMAVALTR